MSEDELRLLAKNRRLTRRIMVPMMGLLGGGGLAGGIWTGVTDYLTVGLGLTFSSVIMLGFAAYYFFNTKEPVELPEKFFVTGVITDKKQTGSGFTQRYYRIELNKDRYACYLTKTDFDRVKVGDFVRCERLLEDSVYADRIVVMH